MIDDDDIALPTMKPKQSHHAERQVVATLLRWPERLADMRLPPEAFATESHAHVLRALREVSGAGMAVDLVSVGEALYRAKWLEAVGGPQYLLGLLEDAATQVGFSHHVALVAAHHERRTLTERLIRVVSALYDPSTTIADAKAQAQAAVMDITEPERGGLVHIGLATARVIAEMEHRQSVGETPGLATGYRDLDAMLQILPGDLVLLGARPGMGKTSLALGIVVNVAKRGEGVAVFSAEMATEHLVMRALATESRVSGQVIFRATALPMHQIGPAAGVIGSLPIWVDDAGSPTLAHVQSECRRLHAQGNLSLVVVDYLQLMKAGRRENQNVAISEISGGLKALAMGLKVPVIALSQLSRAVEGRTDKRPTLSDLRDSGSLEQDASAVLFMYRDEYYNPDSDDKGVCEVIVAKQRNGTTGPRRLCFDGPRFALRDMEQ